MLTDSCENEGEMKLVEFFIFCSLEFLYTFVGGNLYLLAHGVQAEIADMSANRHSFVGNRKLM